MEMNKSDKDIITENIQIDKETDCWLWKMRSQFFNSTGYETTYFKGRKTGSSAQFVGKTSLFPA